MRRAALIADVAAHYVRQREPGASDLRVIGELDSAFGQRGIAEIGQRAIDMLPTLSVRDQS